MVGWRVVVNNWHCTVWMSRLNTMPKELGFTLSETKDLLDLRVTDASACDDVAERARRKITAVEGRIRELDRVRRVLHDLVDACANRVETAECPILEIPEDDEPSERDDAR